MLVRAVLENGMVVSPKPGLKALCPYCRAPVISKCGPQVHFHFAHLPDSNCPYADPNGRARSGRSGEPETDWHRDWKAAFPADWREVPLGSYQADIHTPQGLTIEFQHSPLAYAEVHDRAAHYSKFGPLLWVVDAGALMTGLRFSSIPSDMGRQHHLSFRAERLPAGFNQARDVWLDLRQMWADPVPYVFLVTKWPGRYWDGMGFALSRPAFINRLLKQEVPRPWLLHSPFA